MLAIGFGADVHLSTLSTEGIKTLRFVLRVQVRYGNNYVRGRAKMRTSIRTMKRRHRLYGMFKRRTSFIAIVVFTEKERFVTFTDKRRTNFVAIVVFTEKERFVKFTEGSTEHVCGSCLIANSFPAMSLRTALKSTQPIREF